MVFSGSVLRLMCQGLLFGEGSIGFQVQGMGDKASKAWGVCGRVWGFGLPIGSLAVPFWDYLLGS